MIGLGGREGLVRLALVFLELRELRGVLALDLLCLVLEHVDDAAGCLAGGGQQTISFSALIFLEILWLLLLGKAPPALRAQEQIQRGGSLGM